MFWLNLISSDQLCKTLEETSFRSMAPALPMVKKMVSSLVTSGSKVPRWVLTNFKDPNVELEINTKDVEELKTSLDELKYGGGGDIWEQVLKGERNFFKTVSKNQRFQPSYFTHSWITTKSLIQHPMKF